MPVAVLHMTRAALYITLQCSEKDAKMPSNVIAVVSTRKRNHLLNCMNSIVGGICSPGRIVPSQPGVPVVAGLEGMSWSARPPTALG